MATDEDASRVSLVPNPPLVAGLNVAVSEGVECIREILDRPSDEDGALSRQKSGDEGDDDDSFVDIMSGIIADGGGESEGRTPAEALLRIICQWKFYQRVLLIHLSYLHVDLHRPLAFVCRNKIAAIRIFHKLVSSARLYIEKASWGYCVSVFVSSGEPAALPRIGDSGVLDGSGNESEIGCTISCEECANITMKLPRDLVSSIGQNRICISQDLGRVTSLLYLGPPEAALVDPGTETCPLKP